MAAVTRHWVSQCLRPREWKNGVAHPRVHGGCDSIGCFAMTNPVNAELYDLVSATLRSSMQYVPVHVFPVPHKRPEHRSPCRRRLEGLLERPQAGGYESFERTRLPPSISVCNKRYLVRDALPGGVQDAGIALCPEDAIALGVQGTEKEGGPNKDVAEPEGQYLVKALRFPMFAQRRVRAAAAGLPCASASWPGNFSGKRNASRQQQASKIR